MKQILIGILILVSFTTSAQRTIIYTPTDPSKIKDTFYHKVFVMFEDSTLHSAIEGCVHTTGKEWRVVVYKVIHGGHVVQTIPALNEYIIEVIDGEVTYKTGMFGIKTKEQ